MKTIHRILAADAREMAAVADSSVDLIVTSPPYPMIEMWDDIFGTLNPEIREKLARGDGNAAFELMHLELDRVWREAFRVLRPGCIACINVGDATRTIGGDFRLFSNHSRILQSASRVGLATLPDILWRKQTNAPNKFLGSGMLPGGAYVTYEHEYILILRKGGKRAFASEDERLRRRESAFFWEERNVWFSDVWTDLKGTSQDLVDPETRDRSGAFPFELAHRLVQMHSIVGDTVLDPFLGTGTTCVAAAASARSSIGLEIDEHLRAVAGRALVTTQRLGTERTRTRLEAHRRFIEERRNAGRQVRHASRNYGFPVVTGQEVDLLFLWPVGLREVSPGIFEAEYTGEPPRFEEHRQTEFSFVGPT